MSELRRWRVRLQLGDAFDLRGQGGRELLLSVLLRDTHDWDGVEVRASTEGDSGRACGELHQRAEPAWL